MLCVKAQRLIDTNLYGTTVTVTKYFITALNAATTKECIAAWFKLYV